MKKKLISLSKNLLVKALVVIIICVFALWGVGDMFSAGKTNVVAEISGENIYSEDYVNELRTEFQYEKYKSISDAIDKNLHLKVLNKLIAEKIFEIYAREKKIIITDKVLSNFLKNIPEFSEDNKFSRIKYEKYLLQNQSSSSDFENKFKRNLLKKIIIESKSLSSIYTEYHKRKTKNYFERKSLIEFINLDKVYKNLSVSEKEILNYNKKNPAYSDEYRSIKYATIEQKKNSTSSDLFFKNISEIENQVLSNKRFDQIAEQYSLETKKSKLFSKSGLIINSKESVKFDKNIIKKTFILSDQVKTELLEIKGKFYLIGINKFIKKKPLPLNNILREKIITKVKKKKVNQRVLSLNKSIDKKENVFAKIASKNKNLIEKIQINSRYEKNKLFSFTDIQKIFTLRKDESAIIGKKDSYLVKVLKVSYSNKKSTNEIDQMYEKQVGLNFETQVMKAFDKFLNSKYKVEINQKVLDRITNSL